MSKCHNGGFDEAKKLAVSLGFKLNFDWEKSRTFEGFY